MFQSKKNSKELFEENNNLGLNNMATKTRSRNTNYLLSLGRRV